MLKRARGAVEEAEEQNDTTEQSVTAPSKRMKIKRASESPLANLKSTKPAPTEMYTSKSTPQSPPHDKQATLKPTSAKAIDSSEKPARKLPAGTNDSMARYVMSEADWPQRYFEDRMDEEFAEAVDTVADDLEN